MSTPFKNSLIRSWMLNVLSSYMHYLFGRSKRILFQHHPNTVVEIGPGAGANMRYLRKGTRLIAIEPNVQMHELLKKNAMRYGIELEIRAQTGESLDLPDESYDFVVSTLVLCTVNSPEKCIYQIKRILKPAGVFVFIEHIKAAEHSILGIIQNLLHKPWHWLFEGCHTNRDTKSLLESSGFRALTLQQYDLYSPLVPIMPQIRGWGIK